MTLDERVTQAVEGLRAPIWEPASQRAGEIVLVTETTRKDMLTAAALITDLQAALAEARRQRDDLITLDAKVINHLCNERDELKAALANSGLERDDARAENTRLRAALAMSDQPCVYCTLPAEEWAKCCSGFPGCARADDAVGCPQLGAGLRADALAADLERARALLQPFANFANALNEAVPDEIAVGIFADGGMRFGPNGGVNLRSLRAARAFLTSGEKADPRALEKDKPHD